MSSKDSWYVGGFLRFSGWLEELLNEAEYFGLTGLADKIKAREIRPNGNDIILFDIAVR